MWVMISLLRGDILQSTLRKVDKGGMPDYNAKKFHQVLSSPLARGTSPLYRLSENTSFLKFTYNYKGNTVAMVKMDDIIMSKNENHKPKPHQATQSTL